MDCDRILGALQALQENVVAVLSNPVSHVDASPSILIFDRLGSTNETLWELITTGLATPRTTVIALQQTAGRGQWGREWQSELGGLYLSYALTLHQTITDATAPEHNYMAWLTQCSAWGIATVLRDRGVPVKLKWPNDLLLNKRKLGGILTETKVHNGEISQAVIGVGLNWSNSVPPTGINLHEFLNAHPTTPGVNSIEMLAAIVIWGIELGLMHYTQKGGESLFLLGNSLNND